LAVSVCGGCRKADFEGTATDILARMWLASLFSSSKKADPVLLIALSFMPNEVEQRALEQYLKGHRALYGKLGSYKYLLVQEHNDDLRRWHLSNLFTNYGTILADKRDFEGASGAFLYAVTFFENNPLALACYAELYVQLENQIASRWAKKLLTFKPRQDVLNLLIGVFPEGVYWSMMTDLRQRMLLVIQICSEHPEWPDSYPLLSGIDFYRRMLG
jgi:hypothetical protein